MSKVIRQVERILVQKGTDALLSAAATPDTLAAGQIGVFNASTGLSITTGTTATPFFVAVGLGNGKYRRSAGTILDKNVRNTTVTCYTAPVTQIVDVRGICAECATDYAIKMDITSSNYWTSHGMQPFMQTVTYTSPCCSDGSASCLSLAQGLRNAINNDPNGLFTASLLDPDDVSVGASVIDEGTWDVDTDGCPVIRITANAQSIADFCGIPELYTYPTGVTFTVSTQGLSCCSPASSVVYVRDATFGVGLSGDIKAMEWTAAGNAEVGPYRLTESGVTTATDLNTTSGVQYVQLTLDYDDPIETAFQAQAEPKSLVLAIDKAAAVLQTVGNALDALLTVDVDTALTACA